MKPGDVCRCISEFNGISAQELSVSKNDIVQILSVVDRHWVDAEGCGSVGRVPSSILVTVELPPFHPDKPLFVAFAEFMPENAGDLGLAKGNFVVGLNEIDECWWCGEIYGRKGIFPRNHVWKINTQIIQLEDKSEKAVRMRGQVKYSLRKQLDEELNLYAGDIVNITHIIDKDTYRGESNGERGIFPSNFIDIIEEEDLNTQYQEEPHIPHVPLPPQHTHTTDYNFYTPDSHAVQSPPSDPYSPYSVQSPPSDPYSPYSVQSPTFNYENSPTSANSHFKYDNSQTTTTTTIDNNSNNSPVKLNKCSTAWKTLDEGDDDLFNDDYFKMNMPGLFTPKVANNSQMEKEKGRISGKIGPQSEYGTENRSQFENMKKVADNSQMENKNSRKTDFNFNSEVIENKTNRNVMNNSQMENENALSKFEVPSKIVNNSQKETENYNENIPNTISQKVNEIFSSKVINNSQNEMENRNSVSHIYNSEEVGIEPYGRAIFSFKAQYPNELTFKKGQIIHLIKHIDSHWTLGALKGSGKRVSNAPNLRDENSALGGNAPSNEGRKSVLESALECEDELGIFPTSYIDIIVNCLDGEKERFLTRDQRQSWIVKPPQLDLDSDKMELNSAKMDPIHASELSNSAKMDPISSNSTKMDHISSRIAQNSTKMDPISSNSAKMDPISSNSAKLDPISSQMAQNSVKTAQNSAKLDSERKSRAVNARGPLREEPLRERSRSSSPFSVGALKRDYRREDFGIRKKLEVEEYMKKNMECLGEGGVRERGRKSVFGNREEGRGIGGIGENSPLMGENSPLMGENSPLTENKELKTGEKGPRTEKLTENRPLTGGTGENRPLTGENGPRTTEITGKSTETGEKGLKTGENRPQTGVTGEKGPQTTEITGNISQTTEIKRKSTEITEISTEITKNPSQTTGNRPQTTGITGNPEIKPVAAPRRNPPAIPPRNKLFVSSESSSKSIETLKNSDIMKTTELSKTQESTSKSNKTSKNQESNNGNLKTNGATKSSDEPISAELSAKSSELSAKPGQISARTSSPEPIYAKIQRPKQQQTSRSSPTRKEVVTKQQQTRKDSTKRSSLPRSDSSSFPEDREESTLSIEKNNSTSSGGIVPLRPAPPPPPRISQEIEQYYSSPNSHGDNIDQKRGNIDQKRDNIDQNRGNIAGNRDNIDQNVDNIVGNRGNIAGNRDNIAQNRYSNISAISQDLDQYYSSPDNIDQSGDMEEGVGVGVGAGQSDGVDTENIYENEATSENVYENGAVSLPTADSEETKAKNRAKVRRDLVQEIVTTEYEYTHDLEALIQVISLAPSQKEAKSVDLPALMGNINKIVDIAKKLTRLLDCVAYKEDDELCVGRVFLECADELCEVYKNYCSNHNVRAEPLLRKYEDEAEPSAFLQWVLSELQQHKIQLLDMRSVLIKPVQRILKYPLFLDRLVKETSELHPDYGSLVKANAKMADVAKHINEYTKRLDLINKYRNESDQSFHSMFQRLTLHSVAKKSARISTQVSEMLGIMSQTIDPDYDEEVAKFRCLQKWVLTMAQEVETVRQCIRSRHHSELEIVKGLTEIFLDSSCKPEIEALQRTVKDTCNRLFESFDNFVKQRVILPAKQLLCLLDVPERLIQKRHDKRLDYDNAQYKLDRNRDPMRKRILEEELLQKKGTYTALNSQLMADLPVLTQSGTQIMLMCTRSLVATRMYLQGRLAHSYLNLAQVPGLSYTGEEEMLAQFRVKYLQQIGEFRQLSFIPPDSLQRTVSRTKSRARKSLDNTSKKEENVKKKVLGKYPNGVIFVVTEVHTPAEVMELTLYPGDHVAVLKNKDPLGSSERWFVDDGDNKGFVRANSLKPLPTSQLNPTSSLPTSLPTPLPTSSLPTPLPTSFLPTSLPTSSLPNPSSLPTSSHPLPTSSLPRAAPPPPLPERPPRYEDLFPGGEITGAVMGGARRPPPPQYSLNPQAGANSEEPLPSQAPLPVKPGHHYSPVEDDPPSEYYNMPMDRRQSNQSSRSNDYNSPVSAENSNIYEEIDGGSRRGSKDTIIDSSPIYEVIRDGQIVHQTQLEQEEVQAQFYYAQYNFGGSDATQLNLVAGQVVMVVLADGPDWWFVEDRYGNTGYVPASYLTPYT